MIQPNELRKGNMVIHVDSGIARLITVGYIDAWLDIIFHEEYYTAPRHKILYEKMEPIPLTEDVLRAAGFEKTGNANWYFQIKIGALKWYFRFNCGKPYSELGGIYLGDNVFLLHHMQNMYYCFTGKELEINMEELKKAVG